ncbi:hypothetical protein [Niabella sp.]|uniref:hypothetical protein n=1 Tax=Niabella sp. TaxID=1962976 RepID=UPI00262C498D|nr:hypothetical protein [Niabella sp.]
MGNTNNANEGPSQQDLLNERMNGILPVIDIAGHPHYVDVGMDAIRPHDNFRSPGIPFSEFKDFEMIANIAWLFYNPKERELLTKIDLQQLYEIPGDWIVIEIPQPVFLDPYGFAVKNGWDIKETLKVYPIQENLKARIVPWEETTIPRLIEENKARRKGIKARPRFLNPYNKWEGKGPRR